MEPKKTEEIQRVSEMPPQTFEIGRVSDETKGVSGSFETFPMFKNGA